MGSFLSLYEVQAENLTEDVHISMTLCVCVCVCPYTNITFHLLSFLTGAHVPHRREPTALELQPKNNVLCVMNVLSVQTDSTTSMRNTNRSGGSTQSTPSAVL